MNDDVDQKGAEVKFPPPFIFILWLLFTYVVHYVYPITIGSSFWIKLLGVVIILFSIAGIAYIGGMFKKKATNIEPWKPTTTIISTGIYSYSRNPIYVIFCLISISIGLIVNSLWMLGSFFPSALFVYFIAIKKEEAYLEKKFGEEYLRYKNNVRRWL